MKVLIDECAPRALKQAFAADGYECFTVQEAGWSGKANGELLKLAEAEFDVLVTLDTNLSYQQNLGGRKIGIVVLRARSNRLAHLRPHFPARVEAVKAINPGEIIYVDAAP
jgi:predicted nuclease of predicted toxin-antitoxin system